MLLMNCFLSFVGTTWSKSYKRQPLVHTINQRFIYILLVHTVYLTVLLFADYHA